MKNNNIPFSPPDISEEEITEVVDTLRSGWITTGPKTKLFEKNIAEFCNTTRAVCLNSATAAMELTLRILGVGPGDEVITSAYTYTASASVIDHVGAKVVLVDTQKDSWEIDLEKLENAISDKTKVIIPVDLAGICADYEGIFKVVEKKKDLFVPNSELQKQIGRITVMADGAHSFGAHHNGKMSGEIADFTSFSFHAVKNLTTSEGGAVTWNPSLKLDDEELYKQYQLFSLHGQNKDALAKTKLGSWEYDIIAPLFKCNMTDINASLGLVQLRRYPELLNYRELLVKTYNENLDSRVQVLDHLSEKGRSSMHLYITRIKGITVEQRNQIIEEMAQKGIATNVHYKPLPLLTAYKNLALDIDDYPNAYDFYANEITLPLHTLLSVEDVVYVCETLNSILKEF